MKVVWAGIVMAIVFGAAEAPALACSCTRVLNLDEEIRK
jgi:hypothetical protein